MSSSQETAKRVILPSFEEMMSKAELDMPLMPAEGEYGTDEQDAEAMQEAAAAMARLAQRREKEKIEALCAQMKKDAEAEAARILEQAAREAEACKARAEEQAVAQVQARYEEEIKTLRQEVQKAAEGFAKEKEELFKGMETRLLDVCFKIAESIVHYELDKGEAAYLSIIHNALGMLRSDEAAVLHMPPVGYERIFGGKENAALALMNERQVKVVKDVNVAEGDCFVSSEHGGMRAGVQTQTARLREAVLQKWGEVTQ